MTRDPKDKGAGTQARPAHHSLPRRQPVQSAARDENTGMEYAMSSKGSSSSSSSGGVGFLGLLTIVFIVLKLTHFIDWSWWWVLSPTLITLAIVLAALIVVGSIALLVFVAEKIEAHKRRRILKK